MNNSKDLIRKLSSVELLHKTMASYFSRLKEASETGNSKMAWCTSVGPAELLTAMGFAVHFPENHAAIIGSSKTADQYIPVAVSHGYSPEVCSYLTTDIGAFLKNETPLTKFGFKSLPKPDVLVFNTNQCREVCDWFEYYGKFFDVPVIGIHTPLYINELSDDIVKFVSGQYQALIPKLESITLNGFDLEKFKQTIKLSRDACRLWREVLETATHRPSPINFFDAAIHMGPIVVMRGTQSAVDYYKSLKIELDNRIRDKIGAVPQEDFRLFWDGMPIWFKLSGLAKLFAKLNVCLVASTYCNSWVFDDLDPDDPFDSSALAYSKLFIARSDKVKEGILGSLLKQFSVDGIIYHDAKTCERNSNTRFGLSQRLFKQTKTPYFEIQGDLNDNRCYGEEQAIIAIETFVEQLRTKK